MSLVRLVRNATSTGERLEEGRLGQKYYFAWAEINKKQHQSQIYSIKLLSKSIFEQIFKKNLKYFRIIFQIYSPKRANFCNSGLILVPDLWNLFGKF